MQQKLAKSLIFRKKLLSNTMISLTRVNLS